MKSRLIDHITPEAFQETYIRTDYSAYAMNQVSRILKDGVNDQAVSRREVEAITIDGATSLDLDDAIWVERTENGYCLWVHISDVSEAIPIFSPLDIEALHRTTSVYRKDHILDMFPPELSNNTLSLDPYG
jgi:ribonuclease R